MVWPKADQYKQVSLHCTGKGELYPNYMGHRTCCKLSYVLAVILCPRWLKIVLGMITSSHLSLSLYFPILSYPQDVNDNEPDFTEGVYSASVMENYVPVDPIATVSASDNDIGTNSQLVYSLADIFPDSIAINSITGDIYLLEPLDFELTESFTIQVSYCSREGRATGASLAVD